MSVTHLRATLITWLDLQTHWLQCVQVCAQYKERTLSTFQLMVQQIPLAMHRSLVVYILLTRYISTTIKYLSLSPC